MRRRQYLAALATLPVAGCLGADDTAEESTPTTTATDAPKPTPAPTAEPTATATATPQPTPTPTDTDTSTQFLFTESYRDRLELSVGDPAEDVTSVEVGITNDDNGWRTMQFQHTGIEYASRLEFHESTTSAQEFATAERESMGEPVALSIFDSGSEYSTDNTSGFRDAESDVARALMQILNATAIMEIRPSGHTIEELQEKVTETARNRYYRWSTYVP